MGKGQLDKAKESTAREEGFRGLVGTWKDENWREIRPGEMRRELENEQEEEREDLKKRMNAL